MENARSDLANLGPAGDAVLHARLVRGVFSVVAMTLAVDSAVRVLGSRNADFFKIAAVVRKAGVRSHVHFLPEIF